MANANYNIDIIMNQDLTIISGLLQRASLSVARNESARKEAYLRGEAFNIFRTCGINHYENTHSAILAEWLDPRGSHGQGDLFLKSFIRSLFSIDDAIDTSWFADEFDTNHARVSTEYSTAVGRFDILIEDASGKAIILENKIYAQDQDEQLKRYNQFAREKYGRDGYRLVYLTLDGHEASEQSGDGVDYLCISYRETVTAWLEDCLQFVYDKPLLRETMIQYRNHIKQLTGQNMDKSIQKELVAEMLKNPEAVAAIVNSSSAMERALIEESLFKPLREYAEANELLFDISDKFWEKRKYESFSFYIHPNNVWIKFENERNGWADFYFGIVDVRQDRPAGKTVPGLEGGNDLWPYGWHYFDKHRNWTLNDIVEFARDGGEFLRYITGTVDRLIEAMKSNGIL